MARLAAILARLHGAPEAKKYARRGFIRNAALGAVVIVLAQLGAGFVRFFWPNQTGAFGRVLTVPSAAVPEVGGDPYRDNAGKFWLVHTEDGLMALYWTCPHLGCAVPWEPNAREFHCPCHGSIFAYNGVRLGGPAPRPMDYMTVGMDPATGNILVDTGDIHTRSEYDPSQAFPI